MRIELTDEASFADRRRSPRRRAMKPATILLEGGLRLPCMVRDISEHGVRLKIDNSSEIPETFLLQIGRDAPRPCRTVWTGDRQMGVAFS